MAVTMTYYDLKALRELDLNIVIQKLFNATEIDTKESYNSRKYRIQPNGNNICVTGIKWYDNTNSIGGIGALDLVMYLKSITLMEAGDILSNLNMCDCYTSRSNLRQNYDCTIPEHCDETWSIVKNYLLFERNIPEYLIDCLYDDSLLWSDENRNCVFPRARNSGAYLRGTLPNIKFKRTIGIDGEPYVIKGSNLIIITEAPIDGLSLKFYYETATIISTGGNMSFNKIEPYLKNAYKILLAHDNDKSGDSQASKLMKKIKENVERLRPLYNLKDWNEVIQQDRSTLNYET
jgi:5S rRNA maturation endonuclease (ribonuclease M5)